MNWHGRYINLDRSPDRRQRVEREIARYGLSDRYTRFPAVDGRTLETSSPLSQAEVGIFLSHCRLLEQASAAEGATHIIEDDILMCDLTAGAIERTCASGALEAFDIVFLETFVPLHAKALRHYRALFDQFTQGRWPISSVDQIGLVNLGESYFFGATSYLVGPHGAQKVLDAAREELERGPRQPFDVMIQGAVREKRLRVGCLLPFVTAIDLESAQASTADREREILGNPLVQRLLRLSFFARRDLEGCVIPRLDAVLADMRRPGAEETLAVDTRVLEFTLRL